MNLILSVSLPASSEAAKVLNAVPDGERSAYIRKAVELMPMLDSMERRLLAFGWMLRQRGVCPADMIPTNGTVKVHMHSCSECDRYSRKVWKNRADATFKQSVLEDLQVTWRTFDRWGKTI